MKPHNKNVNYYMFKTMIKCEIIGFLKDTNYKNSVRSWYEIRLVSSLWCVKKSKLEKKHE